MTAKKTKEIKEITTLLRESAVLLALVTAGLYLSGYLIIAGRLSVFGLDIAMFEPSLLKATTINFQILLNIGLNHGVLLVLLYYIICAPLFYHYVRMLLNEESTVSEYISKLILKCRLFARTTIKFTKIVSFFLRGFILFFAILVFIFLSIFLMKFSLFNGKMIAKEDLEGVDGYLTLTIKDSNGPNQYESKPIECNDKYCAYLVKIDAMKQVWIVSNEQEKIAVTAVNFNKKSGTN